MRQWVIGFSLLVPIIVAHSGVAQDSAEPPAPGAYYKAKGGWQKLEELQRTDFKANVFSGAVLSYRGSEAPLQLSDRRPVFYIKTTPGNEGLITDASLNTVIVLLSRKQDHRELKVAKGAFSNGDAGIDKKRTANATVHSISNLILTVTPNEDLAPGEYLLTWDSMGRTGYDFGIK